MVSLDSTFLLDLLKGRPPAVRLAQALVEREVPCCITPPAAVEVLTAAHRLGGPALQKARELLAALYLLPVDVEAVEATSRLSQELMNRSEVLEEGKLLIAGISLRHGESLVTRDRAFSAVPGLTLQYY